MIFNVYSTRNTDDRSRFTVIKPATGHWPFEPKSLSPLSLSATGKLRFIPQTLFSGSAQEPTVFQNCLVAVDQRPGRPEPDAALLNLALIQVEGHEDLPGKNTPGSCWALCASCCHVRSVSEYSTCSQQFQNNGSYFVVSIFTSATSNIFLYLHVGGGFRAEAAVRHVHRVLHCVSCLRL